MKYTFMHTRIETQVCQLSKLCANPDIIDVGHAHYLHLMSVAAKLDLSTQAARC
jgi:hypothetical protein